MNKKFLIILAVVIVVLAIICGFFITQKEQPEAQTNNNENENTTSSINDVNVIENKENSSKDNEEVSNFTNNVISKKDQKGTAGSNMPLKDNEEEAEYQIEVAMQYKLEELYGEDVFDARIYVEKIYTAEEEKENSALEDMNLDENEVAFVVRYEIKPAPGVDVNQFLIPNGEYDEDSEWVTGITRVGVLRPNSSGEQEYEITDFGTGF